MLDGLARPRHVHAVRQVRPADALVAQRLLQHLAGAVAHDARDVVILRRTACWMHLHDMTGALMNTLASACDCVSPALSMTPQVGVSVQ